MILEPIDNETVCFRMAKELLLLFPDYFQVLFWVPLIGHCICQIMSRASDRSGVQQKRPGLMKRHG